MAINIGISPRGLPTPPAMLTPSESAGPCYCHEKKKKKKRLHFSGRKNTYRIAGLSYKSYLIKIRMTASSHFLKLIHLRKAKGMQYLVASDDLLSHL